MGKTPIRKFSPSATPKELLPWPQALANLISAGNCKLDKLIELFGGLSGQQQIVITTREEKSAHMNDRYVTVRTTITQIIGDNPNRKRLLLCNDGVATVYISEQNTVTAPGGSHKGFPLLASTYYDSGSYTGPLYGITAAVNVDVAIAEEI